jgi:hypothetical protein
VAKESTRNHWIFNVSERTLNTWKHKNPRFLQSLKKGKWLADARAAEALFRRALGCSQRAVKNFQCKGTTFEHPYTVDYPPDTTAAIFWLKNRQSELWRDMQYLDDSGGVDAAKPVEEWSRTRIGAELTQRGALPINGQAQCFDGSSRNPC